jgi:hypothetical protein
MEYESERNLECMKVIGFMEKGPDMVFLKNTVTKVASGRMDLMRLEFVGMKVEIFLKVNSSGVSELEGKSRFHYLVPHTKDHSWLICAMDERKCVCTSGSDYEGDLRKAEFPWSWQEELEDKWTFLRGRISRW